MHKVQVWDTAGQDRFRNMTAGFYKKASGIIIVYDCTSEESFENVNNWVASITENAV